MIGVGLVSDGQEVRDEKRLRWLTSRPLWNGPDLSDPGVMRGSFSPWESPSVTQHSYSVVLT